MTEVAPNVVGGTSGEAANVDLFGNGEIHDGPVDGGKDGAVGDDMGSPVGGVNGGIDAGGDSGGFRPQSSGMTSEGGSYEMMALNEVLEAAADFEDRLLAEAVTLFEMGDFAGAEAAAVKAEAAAREAAASKLVDAASDRFGMRNNENGMDSDMMEMDRQEIEEVDENQLADEWKRALDLLANAYEEAGQTDHAEALYLRMLAWREGLDQYRAGHFAVSRQLFKKSPEYKTVDDATWFLRGLRPDDGHAVPEVVGLLALGAQVAAKAAVAVWTLALRPKQRSRITECGGLELVAKAVAYHCENAELQAAGCGALRLLCSGHPLAAKNRRVLIERLGGAEALAASMRRHANDPEVQREACGALHAACNQHPAGARRVVEASGVTLCLEAIVACQDEAVGDAACKALTAMQCASQVSSDVSEVCSEDYEAVWEGKLRAERERALTRCDEYLRDYLPCGERCMIQGLLNAIATFLEDKSVRYRALSIVELVVASMMKFHGYAKVQVPACTILWQLSAGHLSRNEAVSKIATSGGVRTLCQAMKDLPCNEEVQRMAVGALRNVAFGNDAYKTVAVRAGGIPLAVTAMTRYPRDTTLQEHALGLLTSLCDTIGRANLCAKLNGIEAILTALRRHPAVGHIAELGCIILCMFCDDPQLRQMIGRSGGLAIAKALSRTGSNEAQKWGCELLRDLSDSQS
eukprot:TRINITY_DN36122_c0_g1_i1.p1 TRINITY_DN36122_c0_g1~~TRINITY_DN36122_c0_g1_i1.p1  ORF type:complete len:692 (-),score=146.14 TRINITY_DN36122_c0_g1_i1:45-2120(-)